MLRRGICARNGAKMVGIAPLAQQKGVWAELAWRLKQSNRQNARVETEKCFPMNAGCAANPQKMRVTDFRDVPPPHPSPKSILYSKVLSSMPVPLYAFSSSRFNFCNLPKSILRKLKAEDEKWASLSYRRSGGERRNCRRNCVRV